MSEYTYENGETAEERGVRLAKEIGLDGFMFSFGLKIRDCVRYVNGEPSACLMEDIRKGDVFENCGCRYKCLRDPEPIPDSVFWSIVVKR